MTDLVRSVRGYKAEVVKQRNGQGWFVIWFEVDGAAWGSYGANMLEERAREIAADIRAGVRKP